jgi:arsenate reductase-like glutaredoxin family protein
MTCQYAQEFLGPLGVKPKVIVDARKVKIGPGEALALAAKVDRIRALRGKKETTFDLKKERPGEDALLGHLMGRSGSLRAPAAVIGRTLVVGFNADVYREVLGM